MYQLVIADMNKSRLKDFKRELNIYHAGFYPEFKQEAVYRKLSNRTYILRVSNGMTPSDVCGFLRLSLKLSKDESLISLIVSTDTETQNINNYWHYDEFIKEMETSKPVFTEKQPEGASILYLSNYLYMLEQDLEPNHKRDIKIKGAYVITDSLQQYVGKPYEIKRNYKLYTTHNEYGRFQYRELEEWLERTALIIGFKILFYKDGALRDNIEEKDWIGSEIVFVGDKNWKDKITFKLDGKTNAMTVDYDTNEWKMIERKQGETLAY